MFERYDQSALRIVFFARQEASLLRAAQIDSDHLLLGLIFQDKPLLDRLLSSPIDTEAIRRRVGDRTIAAEPVATNVDMPLTTGAKLVLSRAFDEANRLNHQQIGTEHLLYGMLLEEQSFAAEILRGLGLSAETIREDLANRASGA